MSEIKETWESGKSAEVSFWKKVAEGDEGRFAEWKNNLIARARPTAHVMKSLIPFIPEPVGEARILDLAAGPVSCVGWNIGSHRLNVTPIDVLAKNYDAILEEAGITPYIRTQYGEAENIDKTFAPNSIDLVFIRNALDHCYDVPAVIRASIAVLKPGGHFVIHSYRDEAEREKYNGLHQWNITTEGSRFIVHRPDQRLDVGEQFANLASVIVLKDADNWIEVDIQKLAARSATSAREKDRPKRRLKSSRRQ